MSAGRGKSAIKRNERNLPVRKSIRVRKDAAARQDELELRDEEDFQ